MQGQLSEIDIRSILQLIELGQRTGELFVEAYSPQFGISGDRPPQAATESSWLVFFLNGQVVYAGNAHSSLQRLQDHLSRYTSDKVLDNTQISAIASVNAPEYGYLWTLLESHVLTPAQGRTIIQSMVHETLFDLLSLHQGTFIFETGPALTPQLTTLEIGPLLVKIMKRVQEWKKFHPHIQSPDQCPLISEPVQLREVLPRNTFNRVEQWVDGKTSIRQMARYLNRDILTVGKAMYPYVLQGFVQLSYAATADAITTHLSESGLTSGREVPRIVCIDDGMAIRKTVEYTLNQQGYEVTAIGNPLKALGLVFQLKPDLILCDIAMPELDGYEICAMLRTSNLFRQTPIIMLTGKDGFIDRVKARIVGATDYLTKPFGEAELLMLVEKHVGLGKPDRTKPDKLLAEALADELEIDIT
ncbi:MAG: response regulator [Cyanothece sp. SIO1E1]|nr:response regulator [Cyanothece sp. SIO1E1]